jgi:hypothetical protein
MSFDGVPGARGSSSIKERDRALYPPTVDITGLPPINPGAAMLFIVMLWTTVSFAYSPGPASHPAEGVPLPDNAEAVAPPTKWYIVPVLPDGRQVPLAIERPQLLDPATGSIIPGSN